MPVCDEDLFCSITMRLKKGLLDRDLKQNHPNCGDASSAQEFPDGSQSPTPPTDKIVPLPIVPSLLQPKRLKLNLLAKQLSNSKPEGRTLARFPSEEDAKMADNMADSVHSDDVTSSSETNISRSSTPPRNRRKPARPGKVIVCQRCGTTFAKERYLKDHMRKMHEVHECPVCGDSSFYSNKGVERHMKKVHPEYSDDPNALSDLYALNPGDSSQEENDANSVSSFPSESQQGSDNASDPMRGSHLLQNLIASFSSTADLAAAIHQNPSLLSDTTLDHSSSSSSSQAPRRRNKKTRALLDNLKSVNFKPKQRKSKGTGTIPCPECQTTFSELRYLKDHIKRRHMTFECPFCGDKRFNSDVGVEKHIQAVHDPTYPSKAVAERGSAKFPVQVPGGKKSRTTPRANKGVNKRLSDMYSSDNFLTGDEYNKRLDQHIRSNAVFPPGGAPDAGKRERAPEAEVWNDVDVASRAKKPKRTPPKEQSEKAKGNGTSLDEQNGNSRKGAFPESNPLDESNVITSHVDDEVDDDEESHEPGKKNKTTRKRGKKPRGSSTSPEIQKGYLRELKRRILQKQNHFFQCLVCGDKFTSDEGVENHMKQNHPDNENEAGNTSALFAEISANVGDAETTSENETQNSVDSSASSSFPGATSRQSSLFLATTTTETASTSALSIKTTTVNSSVFPTNVSPTGIISVQNIKNDANTPEQEPPPDDDDDDDDNTSQPSSGERKKKCRGTGTIPCPHCMKWFAMKRYLSDHIRRYHKTFKCPYCGDDSFSGLKSVTRHMEEHHEGMTSGRRVSLSRHNKGVKT